jgi:hypothetical protein
MGAIAFSLPNLLVDNNVATIFQDPVHAVVGLVGLGHQIGYFNILPLYIVLLLMLPGLMYLTQRTPAAALLISFAVYVATGTWRLNIPNFPTEGFWYFNPFAWQFLFTIGLVIGARLREGKPLAYSPILFSAALVYLVAGAIWVLFGMYGKLPDFGLPFVLGESDKTYLTANRLLHILAAAYVVGHSPIATWLKTRLGSTNPLVLIGRYGLVSFCTATFLSMIALVLKQAVAGGFFFDTVAVAIGLAIMLAVALALDMMRAPRDVAGHTGAVPAGAIASSGTALRRLPIPAGAVGREWPPVPFWSRSAMRSPRSGTKADAIQPL